MSDWNNYEYQRPPNVLCQFWREGWDHPVIANPSELRPEMNIVGLKWRLTGIGRVYLDSVSPQVRAQIEPESNFARLQPWAGAYERK